MPLSDSPPLPADRILERMPLAFALYRLVDPTDEASLTLVYANPESDRLSGLKAAEEAGRRLLDIAPDLVHTDILAVLAEVARGGDPRTIGPFDYADDRIEGGRYVMHAFGLGDGLVAAVSEEVSDRAEVRALDRERARNADQEARFEALFDALDDVVLLYPLGPSGPEPFVTVNAAAVRTYGYSRDELLGMTPRELVDPASVDFGDAIEELRRNLRARFQSVHLARDGARLPMQTHARLIEYRGRLCVLAVCRDDAEQRQQRRALSRLNLSLERRIAQRTADLQAFADDLQILHRLSTAAHDSPQQAHEALLAAGCEMFGLPVGILSATPLDPATGERDYRIEAVVSPDPSIQAGMVVPLREAFCDAVVERGETVAYHDAQADAPTHPACVTRGLRAFIGTPVVVDGEMVGTLNFVSPEPRPGGFDTREHELIEVMAQIVVQRLRRERAERVADEARERSRALVASVLEAAPDGVMAYRAVRDDAGAIADFELLMANSRACEIVGRPAEELVGGRLLTLFPGNAEAGTFDAYRRVTDSGQRYETEVVYPYDGLDTTFRIAAAPLAGEDGFVVTFVDLGAA